MMLPLMLRKGKWAVYAVDELYCDLSDWNEHQAAWQSRPQKVPVLKKTIQYEEGIITSRHLRIMIINHRYSPSGASRAEGGVLY